MNKRRSCRITALILAVVALILLAVGIHGMTRPISYGASYYHASFYEGEDFNGSMTFYADNTMVVRNTNFDEDLKLLYYYKDGYVFFTVGATQEEYENEVAAINGDFEGAVNTPFYASKINAFRLASEGLDDYTTVYICQSAVKMAVAWILMELVLMSITIACVIRCKRCEK